MLFNIINTLNVLLYYSSGCKKVVKTTLFIIYSKRKNALDARLYECSLSRGCSCNSRRTGHTLRNADRAKCSIMNRAHHCLKSGARVS
jgi:hypothetical protein